MERAIRFRSQAGIDNVEQGWNEHPHQRAAQDLVGTIGRLTLRGLSLDPGSA